MFGIVWYWRHPAKLSPGTGHLFRLAFLAFTPTRSLSPQLSPVQLMAKVESTTDDNLYDGTSVILSSYHPF